MASLFKNVGKNPPHVTWIKNNTEFEGGEYDGIFLYEGCLWIHSSTHHLIIIAYELSSEQAWNKYMVFTCSSKTHCF